MIIEVTEEDCYKTIIFYVDSAFKKNVLKELIKSIEENCPCYNLSCTCTTAIECDCTNCDFTVVDITESPEVSSPDVSSSSSN